MATLARAAKYFKATASRAVIENGQGRHDYAEADCRNGPKPTEGRFISALTACGISMMIADVGPIMPVGRQPPAKRRKGALLQIRKRQIVRMTLPNGRPSIR